MLNEKNSIFVKINEFINGTEILRIKQKRKALVLYFCTDDRKTHT